MQSRYGSSKPFIYLDNAATSFPKPEAVYREMDQCMRNYCANPGRSGHSMAAEAGRMVMLARDEVCNFFGIKDNLQLIFTKNATEAINIALKGLLKPGQRVVTTSMEHNSVIRPLKTMERNMGICLDIVRGNEYGEIDPDDIRKAIKRNTALIVSTLSSNVNGIIMPVADIGRVAGNAGITFLVDASQGAGSLPLVIDEIDADLLAFPGHKGLLGPQGTGGLYVRKGLKLKTIIEGGTGSNSENILQPEYMPDHHESGTLNTPGIAGLYQGVRYICNRGRENIRQHKGMLTNRLHEGLKEINGIKLLSREDFSRNSGIVALEMGEYDSTELSDILDKVYRIASRGGLHCSPLAHDTLGTSTGGLLRLSVGCFNTVEEIDRTLVAFRKISYT